MTATVGQTITRRKATGRVAHMLVDMVHETEHERWLFSGVSPGGGWVAANGPTRRSLSRKEG